MAFKKKKIKKKTKKTINKNDDWAFEGGTTVTNDNHNVEEAKKERRRTQERDESIRRSRMKGVDRKRQISFSNKMSKRIKFSDIVTNNDDNTLNHESDTIEDYSNTKEIKGITNDPNPIPAYNRLAMFINKSLNNRSSRDLVHSFIDTNEMVNIENNDVNNNVQSNNINNIMMDSIELIEDKDVIDDENDIIDENDDEYKDKNDLIYQQFFTTEHTDNDMIESNDKNVKLTLLGTIPSTGDEILGSINDRLIHIISSIKPIPNITMMPGLYKLFSNSNHIRFDELSAHLLPYIVSYADAFIEGRDKDNDKGLLNSILAHTIAHTVKARAKVVKHNQKLKKKLRDTIISQVIDKDKKNKKNKKKLDCSLDQQINKLNSDIDNNHINIDDVDSNNDTIYRDQGFSRPRVLILCPYRGTALQIVNHIKTILGDNTSISGWEKFEDEYGMIPMMDEEEQDKSDVRNARKPEDWKAIFDQNIDDDFKMGIQINPGHGKGSGNTKGAYMRLFSDFFISDIILASPLGLRLAMNSNKSNTSKSNSSKFDELSSDFLSSIEILLIHQADVLYMQNWEHVEHILTYVNKLPTASNDTDFSRVRQYFLEGKAAKHRQLVITSNFNLPEIQAFYREHSASLQGSIRLKHNSANGALSEVVVQNVKQIFQRIPGNYNFTNHEEIRYQYFKEQILAPLIRLEQKHTLIITPSYLHYVRIRNELMHEEVNAAYISEYSRESEISRSRSRFYHGNKHILLYSGRAHFFRRFQIRGAKHIIFYSLPEYANFYAEYVNMLDNQQPSSSNKATSKEEIRINNEDIGGVSCLVLYTSYEKMALERIVGKKRCEHILNSKKTTFMFC